MKLKYYLRGLGIGVICTAIIMGIALSGNKKETLSDIEIIERARLLGMVMPEESQETETEAQDADGDKQGADPQGGDAQESAKKPVSKSAESLKNKDAADGNGQESPKEDDAETDDAETDDAKTDDAKTDDAKTDDAKTDDAADAKAGDTGSQTGSQAEPGGQAAGSGDADVVTIEVARGDFSKAISQKLFDAGLIEDADAFNDYMVQKGVDDMLSTGTHEIPRGATPDQIIEILQGKQ